MNSENGWPNIPMIETRVFGGFTLEKVAISEKRPIFQVFASTRVFIGLRHLSLRHLQTSSWIF